LRGVDYADADLRDARGAYEIEQVCALLQEAPRAIDMRIDEGSLLALPRPGGRRWFPKLQFRDDGGVIAGLREVQEALGYANPYAVLNFLVSLDDRLGDERPIDVLRRGDLARVLESARLIGVQGA